MSKVLVTGASGFIGQHRVRHLQQLRDEVVGISSTHLDEQSDTKSHVCDIATKDSIKYIVAREKPDRIEHFASVAIVAVSRSNPYETYRTNVLGALSVLETAKDFGIPVVIMTTDKYYGDLPVAKEDDRPSITSGAYETSKFAQDIIAQSYRKLGVDVTILRSCNVFGENDPNRRIIPNTIRALQKGESPVIFKNHLGIRQYIYSEDLMSAIDTIIAKGSNDTFNIGTDINLSQEDVVSGIIKVWNKERLDKIKPEYKEGPKINEIPKQFLVYNKLKKLGWKPSWEFEEAILHMIQ